jgi:hypothetical protein
VLEGGEDAALANSGGAGDAGTGCGWVSAAAEAGGDLVHVDVGAFGAEAEASQLRAEFFEEAGDDDGLYRAEVVDEAFTVGRAGSGAGVVGLFEPGVGDLVVMSEADALVELAQESDPGEGERVVDFLADAIELGAELDKLGGDAESGGLDGGILERARIGGDGGEETIGDGRGDGPGSPAEQAEHEFAGRGLAGVHPVEVAVVGVASVVIDVDEAFPPHDGRSGAAQTIERGAVGGNHAIEVLIGKRGAEQVERVEKGEFCGEGIFVPADDGLALLLEGEGEGKL